MALAEEFNEIIDSLPDDWTDLVVELRMDDQDRYVEAAVLMSQCGAQPYGEGEWRWRLPVANEFGNAASAETVHGVMEHMDSAGIAGQLRVVEVQEGRSEIFSGWGRPESVRQEFRKRRGI